MTISEPLHCEIRSMLTSFSYGSPRLGLAVILGQIIPDSKVHGANMGPIWGRQDPGGPHVGPMNFAIWDISQITAVLSHNV